MLSLEEREQALLALIEGDDDHFYGAWKGGPKSAGGGPAAKGAKEDKPPYTPAQVALERSRGKRDEMTDWDEEADPDGYVDWAAKAWETDHGTMKDGHLTSAKRPTTPNTGYLDMVHTRDGGGGTARVIYNGPDGTPVAAIVFYPTQPARTTSRGQKLAAEQGWIEGVMVKPAWRGKGIGLAMYDWVQDHSGLNMYDLIGRTNEFTPAGKAFAIKWLEHRLRLEQGLKESASGETAVMEALAKVRAAKVSPTGLRSPEEPRRKTKVREAADEDHFYGAWKGGSAAGGGRPMTATERIKVKRTSEAKWKDPGEYPNEKMPADFDKWDTDRQLAWFTEKRDAQRKWSNAMAIGVSRGEVDVDKAMTRGWDPGVPRERIGPLPATLYHSTADKQGVLESGRLLTRDEVAALRAAGGGRGLGGGATDTISFTTDRAVADRIAQVTVESHKVAKGDITLQDLRARAKAGGFEDMYLQLATSQGNLAAIERGIIPVWQVPAWATPAEVHARFPNATQSATGGWERRMSKSEAREARLDMYRGPFLLAQEAKGGPFDPLIWSPNPGALATMDPSKVGVVVAKPRKGAIGYQTNGLAEWRTWSGESVEVSDASLSEASSEDHFYGAWRGGSKAQGGGPAKSAKEAEPVYTKPVYGKEVGSSTAQYRTTGAEPVGATAESRAITADFAGATGAEWRAAHQERYDKDPEFARSVDAVVAYTHGDYRTMHASVYHGDKEYRDRVGKMTMDGGYDSTTPGGPGTVAMKGMFKPVTGDANHDFAKPQTYAEGQRRMERLLAGAPRIDAPLYRGERRFGQLDFPKVGDEFRARYPTSMSRSKRVATTFATGTGGKLKGAQRVKGWQGETEYRIVNEYRGAHGIDVAALSSWSQNEVIGIGRFRVASVEQSSPTYRKGQASLVTVHMVFEATD